MICDFWYPKPDPHFSGFQIFWIVMVFIRLLLDKRISNIYWNKFCPINNLSFMLRRISKRWETERYDKQEKGKMKQIKK